MRNTLKKITASVTTALLFALPMASSMTSNAAANANARYTFREVYYVDPFANITELSVSFSCKKAGTSAPFANALLNNPGFNGTITQGNTLYYCNGYTKSNSPTIKGPALSISAYGNTATSMSVESSTARGYAGKTYVDGAVVKFNAFLVGDFNDDKRIDGKDLSIIDAGLSRYNLTNANFQLEKNINGTAYKVYKFDVDGNGVVNSADKTMLNNYISGKLQRFAK